MERTKMNLTLVKISRQNKQTAQGKDYQVIGIVTKEYGDRWLNGWGNKTTDTWKEGDVVTVIVFTQEYQGKEQLRFDIITFKDKLEELEKRIIILENKAGATTRYSQPSATQTVKSESTQYTPDNEIKVETIPF